MVERPNMTWFRDARWGVFMHFLAAGVPDDADDARAVDAWNRRVDGFDVEGLASQLTDVGASTFFITLGQNSGFYLSPNATYDALVGRRPGRCSRRDLVADLAAALEPRGIRLMTYLPSHAPAGDRLAVEGLGCTPKWDASKWQLHPGRYLRRMEIDERLSAFQRNWEAVIREWSLRWGEHVSGWWFDGCYFPERMYVHEDEPNFHSFRAAAKAGNLESLAAFNPGVREAFDINTAYEDYTSGEVADMLPVAVNAPWQAHPLGSGGAGPQFHVLTFLGQYWGQGPPRFPDALVVGYTQYVNQNQGVMTWDVPHTPEGRIPEDFVRQLSQLRR
jgi:hypothetical protein